MVGGGGCKYLGFPLHAYLIRTKKLKPIAPQNYFVYENYVTKVIMSSSKITGAH